MADTIEGQADLIRTRVQLSTVFTPSGPVDDREFFKGRLHQISQAVTAVSQAGQHVILFGERGVGKTSLARLVDEFWAEVAKDSTGLLPVRYNCDSLDRYGSIWSNLAEMINDAFEKRGEPHPTGESWLELFSEVRNNEATPHSVRRLLDLAGKKFVIVIDEFNELEDGSTVRLFASTIKALSDHLIDATLILVGVADTVDQLIEDHASIDRNLTQILMPRMSTAELGSIVQNGYDRVGLTAEPHVLDLMGRLAQGLPHYAHRFGQEAGYAAVDRGSTAVEPTDVEDALRAAVDLTHESIRAAYRSATISPQKDALFAKVLLACALAEVDDLGYFTAGDVRDPLYYIAKKPYDIPQFVGHLKKFCGVDKGPVLQVTGEEWKRRYRFSNPLMRPYVVLRGIREALISEEIVKRFEHANSRSKEAGEQRPLFPS